MLVINIIWPHGGQDFDEDKEQRERSNDEENAPPPRRWSIGGRSATGCKCKLSKRQVVAGTAKQQSSKANTKLISSLAIRGAGGFKCSGMHDHHTNTKIHFIQIDTTPYYTAMHKWGYAVAAEPYCLLLLLRYSTSRGSSCLS
jgi:hypothetical protein